MDLPKSVDLIIKQIKDKYIKDEKFRKDFNDNEEYAIKNHFSELYLNNLKIIGSKELLKRMLEDLLKNEESKLSLEKLKKISGGLDLSEIGPFDPEDGFYSRNIF